MHQNLYILVGDDENDQDASDSGRAYLFDIRDGSLLHTFINPTPFADDDFGIQVSVSDEYSVIGAWVADDFGTDSGAAFVYDNSNGNLLYTLNPGGLTGGERFGHATAVAGNYIAVSASREQSGGTDAGLVHVFDASTGNLSYTIDNPNPDSGDDFGAWAMYMTEDYIVVGARNDETAGTSNTGTVYVFDTATGNILHTLHSPDIQDNSSLAHRGVQVHGHYLIVDHQKYDAGSDADVGRAYLYDLRTGFHIQTFYNPTPHAGDAFGVNVSLSGSHVLIGASADDADGTDSGTVYLYELDNDVLDYSSDTTGINVNLDTNVVSGGHAAGDTISGFETVYGGTGDDTITGDEMDNVLRGNEGADTLTAGDGQDVLIGGSGADNLTAGDGDDIVHGHSISQSTIDSLLAANPNIVWNEETNSFYEYVSDADTWANAKTVAEAKTLNGVQGHLVVITSAVEQSFLIDQFAQGSDIAIGATDEGTEGTWLWTGGPEDGLQFWNGAGSGSGGNNTNNFYTNWSGSTEPNDSSGEDHAQLRFSASYNWNDIPTSWTMHYIIEWDAGLMSDDNAADIVDAGEGDDIIYGYGGGDTLTGGEGNDLIIAGSGNDTVTGGIGSDALHGGDGTDTIAYSTDTAGVNVNIASNITSGGDAAGDTISGFENITGGSGDDTLTGSSSANMLIGGAGIDTFYGGADIDTINGDAGNDVIYGEDGDDIIDGGADNDDIHGGAGADNLDGGTGTDTLNYYNSTAAVTVDIGNNTASGGTAAGDVISNFENLYGSNLYDDTLTGTSGANSIIGQGGDDMIYGLDGGDYLDGGSGTDTVNYFSSAAAVTIDLGNNTASGGSAEGDTILNFENVYGSDGYDDTLEGSSSANTIIGQGGNDIIDGLAGGIIWMEVQGQTHYRMHQIQQV